MRSTALLALFCLQHVALAQQEPTNISTDFSNTHRALGISTDGTMVLAVKGNQYVTMPFDSSQAGTFTSTGWNTATNPDILWRPGTLEFYVTEIQPNGMIRVLRGSNANSNPTVVISDLPPTFRLREVTLGDQFLFGTQPGSFHAIVRIPTSGANLATPVATFGFVDTVDLDCNVDPTGTRLLMTRTTPSTKELRFQQLPASGESTLLLTDPTIQNATWTSSQSCAFEIRQGAFVQIGSVTTTNPGVLTTLTNGNRDHQQLSINQDLTTLTFFVRELTGSTVESVPAIMPAVGGGIVLLTAYKEFLYTPTTNIVIQNNASGPRIAFDATWNAPTGPDPTSQIYVATLGDELTITPRATLGSTLTAQLTNSGAPTNVVLAWLHFNRINVPTAPPFINPILVETANNLLVIPSTTGVLGTGTIPLPTDNIFIGVDIYMQAMTGTPTSFILSRMMEASIQQ
ncbi:MAG: hypothetical protein KDC95_10055 [Planctomycetes bacterium]|nr:hypothetical protein [Planctomycetota bacterium]